MNVEKNSYTFIFATIMVLIVAALLATLLSLNSMFVSDYEDGSLDVDNAIPARDWESFSELSPHHLSHLFHVNQMCILKRDTQQIEYYSTLFQKQTKEFLNV